MKSILALAALAATAFALPSNIVRDGSQTDAKADPIKFRGIYYKKGFTPLKNEDSADTLSYYGGPILGSISVTPVYWASNVAYNFDAFYAQAVSANSGYVTNLLEQYSTSETQISPGTGNTGVTISGGKTSGTVNVFGTKKGTVQYYLQHLVNTGAITPTADTYFPVHFPPGLTINGGSGLGNSCSSWCAFHSGFQLSSPVNGVEYLYFGIIPDLGPTSPCYGGCGAAPTDAGNVQQVASHELAETWTDPQVFLATSALAAPLAWYNSANGEIGDICNDQNSQFTGTDGTVYYVQKLWSNSANACVSPSG